MTLLRNWCFSKASASGWLAHPDWDENGLSTWDSADKIPNGDKYVRIDTDLLVGLKARVDKRGHVSILPKDQSQMGDWIDSRETANVAPHAFTDEIQNAAEFMGKMVK